MNPIHQIAYSGIEKNNAVNYTLSIRLKPDGLSFIIMDGGQIIKAENYEWQNKDWNFTTQNLATVFKQQAIFNLEFAKVLLFIDSPENTLIPAKFFSAENISPALEIYLGRKDFTSYTQKLNTIDAHLAFAVHPELDSMLRKQFPKASVKHLSASLIEGALSKPSLKDHVSLRISNHSFEVIGIKAKKLIGHNSFKYQHVDEFMFLLLSFVKQNGFDPLKLDLYLKDILMNSKIGQNLTKHFPSIIQNDTSKNEKEAPFIDLKLYTSLANN